MRRSLEHMKAYLLERDLKCPQELLTNVTYLCDTGTSIHGVKFWGSPHQPEFHDWGFNLARGQALLDKWNLIPSDTHVVMTHGPPLGHGDLCSSKVCES